MLITIMKGDFMTGIDLDKVEKLIEINKSYLEKINDSSNKINGIFNEINDDYLGKSLDDIYFSIITSIDSLKNINNILNSYVDCLDSVKKNYILQDMSFAQQISHKN